MQAPTWNRELFRETWSQVSEATSLGPTDLAKMIGTSQSTVTRWSQAQTRPSYESLRRLVDALSRLFPKLGDLPSRLLTAAGYGDGYVPSPGMESPAIDEVRRAAAEIEDAARRERVESIIDRTLREMEADQQRRLEQLRDIIGLAKDESD